MLDGAEQRQRYEVGQRVAPERALGVDQRAQLGSGRAALDEDVPVP